MNNLLLIHTPQQDYIQTEQAVAVRDKIVDSLLCNEEFMKDILYVGIILDFFPITNEFFKNHDMRCLSFTQGASIDEKISHNLHFEQNCSIKKLPKNDGVEYEKSVIYNNDSGKFLLESLNPMRKEYSIENVYLCGFSVDEALLELLNNLLAFYPIDKLHVMQDLIYTEAPVELHSIKDLCESSNVHLFNMDIR